MMAANTAGFTTSIRRGEGRVRNVNAIIKDTLNALNDVDKVIHLDSNLRTGVEEISRAATNQICFVIFGCDNGARARLINSLLGEKLLPESPTSAHWNALRIRYGESKQVRLWLSNSEFELFGDLEGNHSNWTTVPEQDLIRKEALDLSTILEIEINNSVLKDSLKILLPPDLEINTSETNITKYKKDFYEFFKKRRYLLESCIPVYLYAVNKIGKCFAEELFLDPITLGKQEENNRYWKTFCYYAFTKRDIRSSCDDSFQADNCKELISGSIFNAENFLDLEQAKSVHPSQQVYFILFSDSLDVNHCSSPHTKESETTESIDDSADLPEVDREFKQLLEYKSWDEVDQRRHLEKQCSFMCELNEQWVLLFGANTNKDDWFIMDADAILNPRNKSSTKIRKSRNNFTKNRIISSQIGLIGRLSKLVSDSINSYLLDLCNKLSEIHIVLLQQFILASFDMAREIQVMPTRTQYVAAKEQQLYNVMLAKFAEGKKRQELIDLMQSILDETRQEIKNTKWINEDQPCRLYGTVKYKSNPIPQSEIEMEENSEAEEAILIEEYDIIESSDESVSESASTYEQYDSGLAMTTVNTFDSSKESGSLVENTFEIRSSDDTHSINNVTDKSNLNLKSIERDVARNGRAFTYEEAEKCTCSDHFSVKNATNEIQRFVLNKLSKRITQRITDYVDCLRDSYLGTMKRCLESLEECCFTEMYDRPASQAIAQLLSSAKRLDLHPTNNYSVLRSIIDRLRRMFIRLGGLNANESPTCVHSAAWRLAAARSTLARFTPHTLAAIISQQILERVQNAHEKFQSSLGSLQAALAAKLHHTEDTKLLLRKQYAPNFARLCLESSSLCDLLKYGVPEIGKEIGRGQYGVVYACRSWGGRGPCAVKSVLPAEQKHFNELAMEFFYTRSIPYHPRVVSLWGSVVERQAGGRAVLLISERKQRDLHCALRTAKLTFTQRMRIAIDIVEGIRYLHSLGLVHRDIKLKNVLLDASNRASISDLGFCACRTLLSGSLVGTPIHMAPELLTADYGSAVDVYAFAILFWYLCANTTRLPGAFDSFQNKEQLWSKVKKGRRPERLDFTDECWGVMTSCWAANPTERALLGDVQPILESILARAEEDQATHESEATAEDKDLSSSTLFNYDVV